MRQPFLYKGTEVSQLSEEMRQERITTMNKIGIIGAMNVEVEKLKKDMSIKSVRNKAGMEFCEGELKGKEVVVAVSYTHLTLPTKRIV